MSQTPPKNLRELLRIVVQPARDFLNEPLPEGVSYWHVTGSLCLFLAGLQILTGVLMAFYYVPSPEVAWESVNYVDTQVSGGRIIHGLHHWGSSAFVVMAFIHILRVFTFGAYKGPRKWTWLIGVALLAVILAFGFTGYLLPWDMKAYFGTTVGTNFATYVPVVGIYLKHFLLGGYEIGELTLPRFYAIHVLVLPVALVVLIGAHLFLIRLYGITPPWKRDDESVEYPYRFFPIQAVRDSSAMLAMLCLLLALAWIFGGNLEAKADPAATDYAPHPEWYFLGLQQLARYFSARLQVIPIVVIPGMFFLGMALLPFLDRRPERRLRMRPVALSLAALMAVTMTGFTIEGYRHLQFERREMAAIAEEEARAEIAAAAEEAEEVQPAQQLTVADELEFNEAMVAYGRRFYEVNRCDLCHAAEDAGRDINIPPGLSFAGDQFQAGWMLDYLKEVPPRRWERKNRRAMLRMPDYKLTERELSALTAYLMTLHQPELMDTGEVDLSRSTPEKIQQGKAIFEAQDCLECHTLDGQGERSSPDLTLAGSRLKPSFIFRMIKNAQAFVPGTPMEESFLDDGEIELMTYYMMSLK